MGKRWRKYSVGKYRLGQLHDQAVVAWSDETGKHRRRLGVAASEVAARALLDGWVRRVRLVQADAAQTVGELWKVYEADRLLDGKQAAQFRDSWRALAPRFEALTSLTWDRVDFEARSIDLRELIPPDPLLKRARKSRAVVPITDLALAALTESKAGALSDHVIEWDGEPVRKVRKGFMAAVCRAGLDDVTPHTLRHTAASWSYNSTASAEFTARLLGHRDPNTSRQIYAHPDVDSLRPAADVIDMKIRRKG